MSRKSLYLAILLAAGCGTKNYNVGNPVVGPPPPRIKDALARQMQAEESKSLASVERSAEAEGIQPVSYEDKVPLELTAVVATVNGRPILASEILEQYLGKLKEYDQVLQQGVRKGGIDDSVRLAKIRETQEMLIKRDLDKYIEQVLMAEAVRSKLKKEQLDAVNEQLANYFEKDFVANLKAKFNVDSTAELEGILQSQGMSLESMRKMFADQQLAQQYVRTKMGEDPRPSRAELLAVYNKQKEKYSQPLQVKWQQLQINFKNGDSKEKAHQVMQQVQLELKAGKPFDDVVKRYSDGPLKDNGGHWDWTQPDSVANADVRKALQTLKPNEISPVITTPTSLQLVKVTARREAGHLPLEEVQEEIRQQIITEFREERARAVVEELRANAVIKTIFDGESDDKSAPKISGTR